MTFSKLTFLQQLVFCSISYRGRAFQDYTTLPYKVQTLLKSVTKEQRHQFRKFGIVPIPVLEVLWHTGFLPNDRAPERGMKIAVLTDYLLRGKYKTKQTADKGDWLWQAIDKEELIGRKTFEKKTEFNKVPVAITLESKAKKSVRAPVYFQFIKGISRRKIM